MRRVLAIGLLGLLALAGCSSSNNQRSIGAGAAAGNTPTPTKPVVKLTTAQLRKALLTVDDMPPGWSISPPDTSSSSDAATPLCTKNETIDALSKGVTVTFVQGSVAPLIVEAAISYGDKTKSTFATVTDLLRGCEGQTWSDTDKDGTKSTYSLSALSFDKFGDESHAWRMSFTQTGGEGAVDLVLVRKGQLFIVVAGISITSVFVNGSVDAKTLATVAAAAVKKA